MLCKILKRNSGGLIVSELIRIETRFAEDAGCSHDGVLRIWSGFTFKAQRILEIECDHRGLGVLQHEESQRADGNLLSDGHSLVITQFRMALIDLGFR